MLTKALPKWKEWNKEREALNLKPIFVNTGVLLLGYKNQLAYYETSSKEYLEKAGHQVELLSANQIKERFPAYSDAVDNGYNIAIFNPIGGNIYIHTHFYFLFYSILYVHWFLLIYLFTYLFIYIFRLE